MEECAINLRLFKHCEGELYSSDSDQKLWEVGDVYAMIDLLVEWDVLSWEDMKKKNKKEKLN